MMRRMAATRSIYHSRSYLRFISFRMRLLPLCTGRWMCLHTLGMSAMTWRVSSLDVFRVRGSETDTYARRCLCHGAQQHWESNRLSVRLLEAIGIDVLSQQGDFLITLCHEVGHFIEDAFHITATLTATGVGNDAVSTEIIAPTHDGDEAGDVVSANARGDDIPDRSLWWRAPRSLLSHRPLPRQSVRAE